MTTQTIDRPTPMEAVHPMSGLGFAVRDTLAMTWRNLLTIRRLPQLLVFATIQPLLFVLMFRYVFGGSIEVPGVEYVNYLMPGIFAQVIAFGAINTAVGLAEDRNRGLIERLRSLPMARSAVLAGRTLADLARNVLVVALMLGVGFLVGFRVQTNGFKLLLGLAVLLFFGYSLSWIFAFVGLSVPNAETAQAAAFPIMLPLVFASSAFVSTENMPDWLRVFAEHQPVTAAVDAVRALVLGGEWAGDVLASLAWTAGILLVFVPLSVSRYRRGAAAG
ncbi:ABC transporter permease [Miltoncostaea oceani]|uniref:ABC transporter permease n=1 Tax=Miltoncostaea oceani TaxID=2843216 RepID=UPI001C3C84C7|nr:ABC transporter permease [Miltoncostaea oceani]